jgi:hypothetical protein
MFSVVLLVVAGLFVRSLYQIQNIKLGYDVPRLVTASVSLPGWRTPDSATLANAADRIRGVRGVEQVAMATAAPFGMMLGGQFYTTTDSGRGDWLKDEAPTFMDVSANYFNTVGMQIVRGRGFDPDPGWTVVINETMEHEYWPRGDAIGQCMWLSKRGGQCYRIVGIAENAHRRGVRRGVIEKPHAHYFVPLLHPFAKGMAGYTIIVRANPSRMSEVTLGVQRILKEAFPAGRPTIELTANRLAPAYRPFRLGATLFTAIGLLALAVSTLGIYSSVAYSVTRRTHEFGVRVALGAETSDVVNVVLRQGLTPVFFGVMTGVALALGGGKIVESLLYSVSPRDVTVMVAVPVLLLAAGVAAALVPSLRAARVDPIVTLRAD